jgi:hypothetical protein
VKLEYRVNFGHSRRITTLVYFRQFPIELGNEITNPLRIAFVDDGFRKVLPYLIRAVRQYISNPATVPIVLSIPQKP